MTIWPVRPTCHGETPMGFGQPEWRPSDPTYTSTCDCGYDHIGPYGYPFRTCSHCGSIHPGDFAEWCKKAPVTLGGSDWKYGYPHKLYVEGIPNPLAGQLVDSSSTSRNYEHEPTEQEIETVKQSLSNLQHIEARVRPPRVPGIYPGDRMWNVCVHGRNPPPQTSFAKLYTAHLEDEGYDDEAMELILNLINNRSGITFYKENGVLKYRAPYFGYQR